MLGLYSAGAQLVVLALVGLYVFSPKHSAASRVVVVAIYLASFAVVRIFAGAWLASLLIQVALGIVLIIRHRIEYCPDSAI